MFEHIVPLACLAADPSARMPSAAAVARSDTDSGCCGSIRGKREGSHLTFSFGAGSFGLVYSADMVVSDDGTRMGGYT